MRSTNDFWILKFFAPILHVKFLTKNDVTVKILSELVEKVLFMERRSWLLKLHELKLNKSKCLWS